MRTTCWRSCSHLILVRQRRSSHQNIRFRIACIICCLSPNRIRVYTNYLWTRQCTRVVAIIGNKKGRRKNAGENLKISSQECESTNTKNKATSPMPSTNKPLKRCSNCLFSLLWFRASHVVRVEKHQWVPTIEDTITTLHRLQQLLALPQILRQLDLQIHSTERRWSKCCRIGAKSLQWNKVD